MKRDLAILAIVAIAVVILLGHAFTDMGKSFQPGIVNGRFPTLDVADLDGHAQHYDARGPGVAAVTFFATWCTPCQHEMPGIAAASRAPWAARVRFAEIDVAETSSQVHTFLERYGTPRAALLIGDTYAAHDAGVVPLPETLIIAPDGKILHRHVGFMTPVELRHLVSDTR